MSKNEKGALLKQASILAIAGLITRIIGLLYRSPMNAIIGPMGSGYYVYAYTAYSIILLIASYSIPMAVSKVMSERIALKEYKNAQKMFKGALMYVIVVGGIASLVVLFGAKWLLPKGQENAILALRILAPTILLSGILGVFRGYFQAHNTMMPTSVSQIVEQILNAIVSVGAAWLLTRAHVGNEVDTAIYGAAGGTIGTGAGVLLGLLFMIYVYKLNSKTIKRKIASDRSKNEESYQVIFKVLILMVTPVIFSTCIYNLSSYVDQKLYSTIMLWKGIDAKTIAAQYGLFGLQYMTMINIPVALASAMSSTIVPAVASSYAMGDHKGAGDKIDEGVRFTMFIAIPSAVGMGVLGIPLMKLLFPGANATLAGTYLMMGAVSIIFYCLSTVTNGVLQGIGKPMLPVKNAAIALVINIVVMVGLLMLNYKMAVVAVIIATVLYSMSITVLNALSIRKHLHYKNEIKDSYLRPLGAAAVMGIVVAGVYFGLYKLLPQNYITNAIEVMIAIILGVIVYILVFIMISDVEDEELMKFPGGRQIARVANRIRRK